MKINRIFIVSILLLAILTLGAVSAADDSDDIISESQDSGTDLGVECDSDVLTDDFSMSVDNVPSTVKAGEKINPKIKFSQNVTGEIEIDDEDDNSYDWNSLDNENSADMSFTLRNFGNHNMIFKFTSSEDDSIVKTVSKNILVKDYVFEIDEYNSIIHYGEDAKIAIFSPVEFEDGITVTLNGKDNVDLWYDYDESSYIAKIESENIAYGVNKLTVKTPKYENYAAKTSNLEFNATPRFITPDEYLYNGENGIVLNLPEDATGNVNAVIDSKKQTPVQVKNGKAVFKLPLLDITDHEIELAYEGNYPSITDSFSFYVHPNLVYNKYMWINDEKYVKVEIPEKYTGEVKIYLTDENKLIGSANLVKGVAKIKLNIDEMGYKDCNVEYENILNKDFSFEIMDENPDWDMNVTIDKLIVNDKNQEFYLEGVPSFISESNFELYIDGVKVKSEVGGSQLLFDATGLDTEKEHTYEVRFTGDGYFKPVNASGKFNVYGIRVNIPDENNLDGYDGIIIETPEKTTGKAKIYVDGVLKKTVDIKSDEDYYYIDMDFLKYGKSQVKVEYTGNAPKTTVAKTVDTYYTLSMGAPLIVYGDGEIILDVPRGIKDVSKVTVKINGKTYKAERVMHKTGDWICDHAMAPADLPVGNYTVEISYPGDSKFPAKTTTVTVPVQGEFQEKYNSHAPDTVYLILPSDAKGKLNVYIYEDEGYELFKSIDFVNGKASYSYEDLKIGSYDVLFAYNGDDYDVENKTIYLSINPDFKVPVKMVQKENQFVSVNIPGYNGFLDVQVDSEDFQRVELVDGYAKISLSSLKAGEHELRVAYVHVDDEGDECEYYDDYFVTVVNPIVAKDMTMMYSDGSMYKVQIINADKKGVAGAKVTFYINGKQVKALNTNKNGYASIKITNAPATYKIKTVYNGISVTKKLTVKHVVKVKTVTVKKSAKKLVLTATLAKVNKKYLKGKTVTFKFNGKTYKAKTNSKGVAKLTVKKAVLKKLKVGKKITYQATYLKDTVKKSVKVKK